MRPGTSKKGPGGVATTPTILQMEAVECGAASLAMILAYFGRWIPLERLRFECGVTRDGSNAGQLAKVARAHGLEAKGKRYDLDQLRSEAVRPMILFWGFGHFVVFEGMRGSRFQINDPAGGRRLVDATEFSKSFTGIGIEFERGPDFEPEGNAPTLLHGVGAWLRGNRLPAIFAILCGVFLAIPGALLPGFTGAFIDKVVEGGSISSAAMIIGGILLLLVLQVAISWLQAYTLNRLVFRMFLIQSSRMATRLLTLPVRFFMQRSAGDLVQRLTSNQMIATSLGNHILLELVSVVTAVIYAAVLIMMQPLIGILAVVSACVLLVAVRLTNVRVTNRSTAMQREVGRQYGVLMEMLRSIPEIKAGSRESDAFALWSGYQAKGINAQQSVSRINTWLDALPVVVSGLIVSGIVLTLGGWEVMNGRIGIGDLVAMQLLAGLLLAPINQIVMLARTLQTTQAEMNRVLDVVNYREPQEDRTESQPEPLESEGGFAGQKLSGTIVLDQVTFGFNHLEAPQIENCSLDIPAGRLVALVGPSGSGKSILADLILGIERPWSGSVLFDGVDRERIPSDTVTQSVSGTSGVVTAFAGTLRENVTMWDPTLDEDLISDAIIDANCTELLSRPGGLEARIEEGGRNLSGGQRQRLEIARCLVTNPSLVVFDGATSALDGRTESRLLNRLRLRGCTVILITGRRSTLSFVDEVVMLESGVVVDRGTAEELHERQPWFATEFGGDA